MMPQSISDVPFDLIFDPPLDEVVTRRIATFAGFVQSDRPLPELRFFINGAEQAHVARSDIGDPNAPVERRHTAYWRFYFETPRPGRRDRGAVTFEALAEGQLICRRFFRCACQIDRTLWDRPLVYFMHVPKTAGSSLRWALLKHEPVFRQLYVYTDRRFCPPGQFRTFTPAALDDLDLVGGHFRYGVHTHSPRLYKYVSLIRSPAAFLKSYYLFGKYVRRQAGFTTIQAAIEEAHDPAYDNFFTRYFSGKIGDAPVDEGDLARAMDNIERDFAYVGTAERHEASMMALSGVLGLSLDELEKNATPVTPETDAIDPAALADRYAARIALDERLYAFVEARFGATSPARPLAAAASAAILAAPARSSRRPWLRRPRPQSV